MNEKDLKYLFLTLRLARKGEGFVSPNPLVGAIITKNNKIVGSGFHEKCGRAHAEINALRGAGKFAKGATLYVNLEPCSHYGRTPPCTDAIIKAGIKRVVIGIKDPNSINNGRGIKKLRKAGIVVELSKNKGGFEQHNEIFIKYITRRLPFIAVKTAQTLDGKIATRIGTSKWITSENSRNYAQRLRKKYDAIMVGVNTILKDEPYLSCRYLGKLEKDTPVKIIVDTSLRTPLNAKIFSRYSPAPVIIATTKKASKKKIKKFDEMGVDLIICPLDKNKKVDLKFLFFELAKYEISSVLVEGGSEIIGSCFDSKLVDKVHFFIALKIIGGNDAISSVGGNGAAYLQDAFRLYDLNIKKFKADILIEGNVAYSSKS